MSANQIIQSLWIGGELSPLERLCVSSYLSKGHSFHLYTYEPINNLPKGTETFDANTIIDNSKLFKDHFNTWASFADWFRYKLLYMKGGWWSDMDVICLKYLDFSSEYCFCSEKIPNKESKQAITNCIIKSPPGSDFLLELLNYIDTQDLSNVKWGQFGPRLLEKTLSTYESDEFIMHWEVFCPINWYEYQSLFRDKKPKSIDNAYTIHLWNEMWNRGDIDKYATFPENSIIEYYKRKYSIH